MSRNHAKLASRQWARVRKLVFRRDSYKCVKCGKYSRLECHHVVEIADGGEEWALSNLATLCRSCHIAHHQKSAPPPDPEREAWRVLVADMLQS